MTVMRKGYLIRGGSDNASCDGATIVSATVFRGST